MNSQKSKFGNLFRLWMNLIWFEIKFTEYLLKLFNFFENWFRTIIINARTLKSGNNLNIKVIIDSN